MINVEELAVEIVKHKRLYYVGKPKISDSKYDALEEELRQAAPNHPALQMVGYAFKGGKYSHSTPMLSLAKTYDIGDLSKFLTPHTPGILSEKIDGVAVTLKYRDGRLCLAATRGNGSIGEEITEHIFHMISIPKEIPDVLDCEVRGEIFFPLSRFSNFKDLYDSPRNAVAGAIGRKEMLPEVLAALGFCAYDIIGPSFSTYKRKLNFLSETFQIPSNSIVRRENLESLEVIVDSLFQRDRDYLIDGLVLRISSEEIWSGLGFTSHHPKGSLAFKRAGTSITTKILQINHNVGRTGKVSFVAQLDPVYISNAKITFATLHNAAFIEAGRYAPNALVRIERSGEVIPSIIGLESEGSQYFLPTHCPCGQSLVRKGPDLFCTNETCPQKSKDFLVYFMEQLDIADVSDKLIERLGFFLQTPADVFRLTKEQILTVDGFAGKSATKLISAIQAKRIVPLSQFLRCLGLARGGVTRTRQVATHFRKLDSVLSAEVEDFSVISGWAGKSAQDFFNSLQTRRDLIRDLLTYMTVSEEPILEEQTCSMSGKQICITGTLGKGRSEYKKLLASFKVKMVDSVTSKTDFLVCNEPSSSSKYVTAQKLQIPIITELELQDLLK